MVQMNSPQVRSFPSRFPFRRPPLNPRPNQFPPRFPKKKKFYLSKYFWISALALIVLFVLILILKSGNSVCEEGDEECSESSCAGETCVSKIALKKADLESEGFIVIGELQGRKIYGEWNKSLYKQAFEEVYGIYSETLEGYSTTFQIENEYTYDTINFNGTSLFYPGASNFNGTSYLIIFDSYENAINYYSSFNKPYNQTTHTYNYYYTPKIVNISYIFKTTEKTFRYEDNNPRSKTIDYYIEDYQVYFVYNRMFFYMKIYKKDVDLNKLVAISNRIINRYNFYIQ